MFAFQRAEDANHSGNCCRKCYFAVMLLQWREATQFVKMGRHNCLWLTKVPLERLQCILVHLVHSPTVCKLHNCCLRFACHKRFQIRQLHIVREWCGVGSAFKLTNLLVPLQWVSLIMLHFPLRKMIFFGSSQ